MSGRGVVLLPERHGVVGTIMAGVFQSAKRPYVCAQVNLLVGVDRDEEVEQPHAQAPELRVPQSLPTGL